MIKETDIPKRLVGVLGRWHASRIDKMVGDVIQASLKTGLERIAMSDEIMKAVVELGVSLRAGLFQRIRPRRAAQN